MRFLPPLILFGVLCGILEFSSRVQLIPPYLAPAPLAVFQTLIDEPQIYATAFSETLSATLSGFILSLLLGGLLACLFSLNKLVRNSVLPFFVFFQIVPVVAIAPLLVIWFGFGAPTVRAAAVIVSVFPILANTLSGLSLIPKSQDELFRTLGATPWQRFIHLQFPSAVPTFFEGARIAAGLAVIGAIVGEFIAGGGLGSLIDSARTQQRLDQVFAAILLSAVLGLLLIALIDSGNYLINRIRPYQKAKTHY